MAFEIKKFSGRGAGSGLAPSIFTYQTEDTIADLTANGYFDELGGTLEIGDVIIATMLTAGATVTRSLIVNLSTTVDSKTALITVFVGDIRATDDAGYQSNNFSGNIGAGSGHAMYTYRNNGNTEAEILALGYFNELAYVLNEGDIIIIVSSDGATYARVADATDGVVTTEAIAFA